MVDDIDRKLLTLLSEDARRSFAVLGLEVGLSAPSVHARVKKLEREGVIRRYTIETDSYRLGYHIAAVVAVQQQPGFHWERLERRFLEMPEIESCHSVTGDDTYVLGVRVRDPGALEDLLRNINCLEGVASTRTLLILSTTFERRRI